MPNPKTVKAKIRETRPANETILGKAERIVMGDREEKYGHPADNHKCTVDMWNAYLHRRWIADDSDVLILNSRDVCFLNILQKVSRCANKISKDSLADIAGWARCVERIMDVDETNLSLEYPIDNLHEFSSIPIGGKICERCHNAPEHELHFQKHEFRPDAHHMQQCVYCDKEKEHYFHDVGSYNAGKEGAK